MVGFWPDNKSTLEIIQIAASAVFPLVSLLGVLVALWAVTASRRIQKEVNGRRAYFDYIKVALDNPKFANPRLVDFDLNASCLRVLVKNSKNTNGLSV
jgi:hypothetical protein